MENRDVEISEGTHSHASCSDEGKKKDARKEVKTATAIEEQKTKCKRLFCLIVLVHKHQQTNNHQERIKKN